MKIDILKIINQITTNVPTYIADIDFYDNQNKSLDYRSLLPIDRISKGHYLSQSSMTIEFKPHPDYGVESYNLNINFDNNSEREEKLNKYNTEVKKYNQWIKNNKKLQINKDYFIEEIHPWGFIVNNNQSQYNEEYGHQFILMNKELYLLKEELDENEFINGLNKSILLFLKDYHNQSKEYNSDWKKSKWYQPYNNFVKWFENKNIKVNEIVNIEKLLKALKNNGKTKITTRPKDENRDEKIVNLNTRYYHLKNVEGYTVKKCLKILVKEFPEWKESTIKTYLK